MTKNSPHRRKKQSGKSKTPKEPTIDVTDGLADSVAQEYRTERNWLAYLMIVGLVILASVATFLLLKPSDDLPKSQLSTGSTNSRTQGIQINGGNLGQLGQQGNSGIQSSNNPSTSTNSSNGNSQSSALQPTIDKCLYQRYSGQAQSPQCLND